MDMQLWQQAADSLRETPTMVVRGRVTRVGGMLVDGVLRDASLGMTCEIGLSASRVLAEVVAMHGDRVSLMPLGSVSGITVGASITPLGREAEVEVGPGLMGRVLDGWGRPIDGKGPLAATDRVPLVPPPLNPMARSMVTEPLPVGVRAIDGMLTSGSGQRLAIMAGAGVGKSTLLGMMARHTEADVTVMALVGERSREVRRFVEAELGEEGLARAVVVAATSNMASALRIRSAHLATAIAEYYRDQGKRVLLLMDSLTRVCMAQRELGLAIGEPPTTRGYPPSAFALVPRLLERAGPGVGQGSITACYTVLLEGDDLGDPVGDTVRAVSDGHVVLDRNLANQGHYPAINVLASSSRVMTEVVTAEHDDCAALVRRTLADLAEAQELLTFGAYRPGDVPRFDKALALEPLLRDFLVQRVADKRSFSETREALAILAREIATKNMEVTQ